MNTESGWVSRVGHELLHLRLGELVFFFLLMIKVKVERIWRDMKMRLSSIAIAACQVMTRMIDSVWPFRVCWSIRERVNVCQPVYSSKCSRWPVQGCCESRQFKSKAENISQRVQRWIASKRVCCQQWGVTMIITLKNITSNSKCGQVMNHEIFPPTCSIQTASPCCDVNFFPLWAFFLSFFGSRNNSLIRKCGLKWLCRQLQWESFM